MARTPAQTARLGAITVVLLLIAMAAAFNLQKFPGFRGTSYHAELTDAGGLHVGCIVQIAGIRVGRVDQIKIVGDHVDVTFDIHNAEIGPLSSASVQVLNLLGEKYLEVDSAGRGTMASGGIIPVSRTDVAYDIVGTLDTLTQTTDRINTAQLSKALSVLGSTLNSASPEVESSFTGISRLSRTIASRDQDIRDLLVRADHVTALLDARKGDVVVLMKQADLLFREVRARSEAIHALLVNTRRLSLALTGIAKDNQRAIGPALDQLGRTEEFLNARLGQLRLIVHRLAPYVDILGNIIGTGPWFDNYVVNLGAVGSGEFQPGR